MKAVPEKEREVLDYVGRVEEAMVKGFPFEVPAEYAQRPLLLVSKGEGGGGVRAEAPDAGEQGGGGAGRTSDGTVCVA